jgi:hypothetical protein
VLIMADRENAICGHFSRCFQAGISELSATDPDRKKTRFEVLAKAYFCPRCTTSVSPLIPTALASSA